MKSSTFFLGHGLHPLPDDLPPPGTREPQVDHGSRDSVTFTH